ncbi:MAG: MBL fold metallo-hydrolase [Fidelibacterota bacterium]
MELCFRGTRGSIPKPITEKTIGEKVNKAIQLVRNNQAYDPEQLPFHLRGTYGGNTACVEVRQQDEYMIFDAGTGLREFGNQVMADADKSGKVFNIFLSHPHWDHIQGFPFFLPAYMPGNIINIYGFHRNLDRIFDQQQSSPFFPVSLSVMQAVINFKQLEIGKEYDIAGCRISGIKQNHPGDSYGYALEKEGKKIIYSTDNEHWDIRQEREFIEFCKNADLLIMDAQYSFADANFQKENWGHSSNIIVTELAVAAEAKKLCLFHHDPNCSDKDLDRILQETRDYLTYFDSESDLEITMAYDGLVLKI